MSKDQHAQPLYTGQDVSELLANIAKLEAQHTEAVREREDAYKNEQNAEKTFIASVESHGEADSVVSRH